MEPSCFITPDGLNLLRHGCAAPIWRHVATLGNCLFLNLLCFAILLFCVGYIVRRMCFWLEPVVNLRKSERCGNRPLPRFRLAPYFAMAAFAVVPQFAGEVTRLSPFLLSLVPPFLSAAVIASLNSRLAPPDDPEGKAGDDRRHVLPRFALAGALAAVGAWEGPCGSALTSWLWVGTWFGFIRRGRKVSVVSAVWLAGFLAAFFAEPMLLNCPWDALLPNGFRLFGLVVFALIGILPLAVVRRFGENRWTLGGWTAVLLVVATITVRSPTRFSTESASERFVRHVLADVGGRKLLIGDGFFDVMVDEFKPADVRRIGTTSVEEREFLINLFGNDEPVTNTVVLVNRYYDFAEMPAAADEAHAVLMRREPQKALKKMTEEERTEIAKLQAAAFAKLRQPVAETLEEMANFDDVPESLRKEAIERARRNIRAGWKNGFCGQKLSATLLALDVMCGDRAAAESDALTALTLDRDDPAANAMLGGLRLQMGQYDRAERYLLKGVKGGGTGACNDLAMLFVKTGRAAKAETWARKAVRQAPDDWNVRETLVQVLVALDRHGEATKELDAVERLAADRNQLGLARPAIARDREALVGHYQTH